MNWKEFLLEARRRGLLLQGEGRGEVRLGDALLIPLRTPKDPRTVYELVKLVSAYAHPAERAVVVQELCKRYGKRADIANNETRVITWHHPWRFPPGENRTNYSSLGEYLASNDYMRT